MVDLFAGPGGLDIAATALDVEGIGVEWDDGAYATRQRADLLTRHGDVRDFNPTDPAFQGTDPDIDSKKKVNVLAGGPPCQTFTVAGTGDGRRALEEVLAYLKRLVAREPWEKISEELEKHDVRTGLVLQPLRWALEAIDNESLSPYHAIVLEQVPAVLPVWKAYEEALGDLYDTDSGILHTEEFGVPQTRRRAVFVARLKVGDPELSSPLRLKLPSPTHERYVARKIEKKDDGLFAAVPVPVPNKKVRPWVSMEKALPGRPAPFTVISNYGTGGDPKARGQRRSDQPSATVTGKNSRNRIEYPDGTKDRFTVHEAGQLQTFPAAYPWSGKDISQQIGNAVPPRLGMHIISAALGLAPPTDDDFARLRDWKPAPTPPDEEAG
jgi:DNA (cytosine-5)-methyltransferase 1